MAEMIINWAFVKVGPRSVVFTCVTMWYTFDWKSLNKHRRALVNTGKKAWSIHYGFSYWKMNYDDQKQFTPQIGNRFLFFSSYHCQSLNKVKERPQLELCLPLELGYYSNSQLHTVTYEKLGIHVGILQCSNFFLWVCIAHSGLYIRIAGVAVSAAISGW